jgi:hypothetical protein
MTEIVRVTNRRRRRTPRTTCRDLGAEYAALRRLAPTYDAMTGAQQFAFYVLMVSWMLAADITTDATYEEDAVAMRRLMAAPPRVGWGQ